MMWDIPKGDLVKDFTGHSGWGGMTSVFVSELDIGEGKKYYLFTGSNDDTVKMWDISKDEEVQTFSGHTDWLNVFVSGNYLFTGHTDNTAKMWDISTGNKVRTFSGHNSSVWSVFVSGDNLFTGSFDKTVKMWEVPEFYSFQITKNLL